MTQRWDGTTAPEPKPLGRRTRLRQVSDKRAATFEPRRQCMVIVRERDKVCQFWNRLEDAVREGLRREAPEFITWSYPTACWHPMGKPFGDGHEPEKQSHGADYTDPEQVVLLCRAHHRWITEHPREATLIGL